MKKLSKILISMVLLTGVAAVCVIFWTLRGEAMKGSESPSERYLKEESFWERYGVSPEGLVLWLDQSDPRSYGDASNWYDLSGKDNIFKNYLLLADSS